MALLMAGCGDDATTGDATTGDARVEPATIAVDIGAFVFEPATVSVDVGDAVVWTNSHDQPHTSTGTGAFDWDTGNLAAGEEAAPVTFTDAGTFTYRCALHPFMEGTVEVSA